MKEVFVSQSQKARWMKTGAILFGIVCLFFWLSPRGVQVQPGKGGKSALIASGEA